MPFVFFEQSLIPISSEVLTGDVKSKQTEKLAHLSSLVLGTGFRANDNPSPTATPMEMCQETRDAPCWSAYYIRWAISCCFYRSGQSYRSMHSPEQYVPPELLFGHRKSVCFELWLG